MQENAKFRKNEGHEKLVLHNINLKKAEIE